MPLSNRATLRTYLSRCGGLQAGHLWGRSESVALARLGDNTSLPALENLSGRSVILLTKDMLSAALALVDLDGVARRVIICPPDFNEQELPAIAQRAGVDAVVFDELTPAVVSARVFAAHIFTKLAPLESPPTSQVDTEWLMFTSGTTGAPKLVVHSLSGLSGAIETPRSAHSPPVWGTFYDIRRYGGLQILLRALLGNGSLVLADRREGLADFLRRLGGYGASHVTGTPSHWRSVLMSSAADEISPKYIRLSGEAADQAVLDGLRKQYPGVPIVHAYASTEAGVGFEVDDGRAGFPAALVERRDGDVQVRIKNGTLQLRSGRTALRYLDGSTSLLDPEGFVNTGDIVERRGDRWFFVGREGGVINVGGLKVHPEEVEAQINRHPSVRVARVFGRRNPIMGMVVLAEVVLDTAVAAEEQEKIRGEILSICRDNLEPFKAPMRCAFVDAIPLTSGGKVDRRMSHLSG